MWTIYYYIPLTNILFKFNFSDKLYYYYQYKIRDNKILPLNNNYYFNINDFIINIYKY